MRLVPRATLACVLLGACASTATAAPTATPVPGISSSADSIAKAADGTIWVTEPDSPGRIAKISASGTATEYKGGVTANLPANLAPGGITTYGSKAYFILGNSASQWGSVTSTGELTRMNLAFDKPTSITTGPDGNIWLTTDSTAFTTPDAIVRYNPETNTATSFSTGLTYNSQPFNITAGADGALWFIEAMTGRVGRITTAGAITFRSVGGTPTALGASNGTTWFSTGLYLGAMGTSGNTLFSTAGQSNAIAHGADGATWGAATGGLVRLAADGTSTFHAAGVNPSAVGRSLLAGDDGHLWMTLDSAPYLVRVTVPPRVADAAATATGATTASVTATVQPNGVATVARVERELEGGGWTSLAETAIGDGTAGVPVSFSVSGLTADATNTLRIVGVNDAGAQSQTMSVETPEEEPEPEPTTPEPTTPEPTTPEPTTPDPEPTTPDPVGEPEATTPEPTTPEPTTPEPTTPEPTTPEPTTPEPTTPEPTTPEPTTPPTTPEVTTPEPTTPPTTPEVTTPEPTTPEPTTPEPTTPPTTPVPTTPLSEEDEDDEDDEDEDHDENADDGDDEPAPAPTTPSQTDDEPAETVPPSTPEPAPTTPPAPAEEPAAAQPEPVQGASVVITPDRGVVKFRVPGSTTYLEVTDPAAIPTGSVIDTTKGAIVLTSQVGDRVQHGTFSGGQFRVAQIKATGMTQVKLAGHLDCPTAKGAKAKDKRATRAAKKTKKKRRHVWGQDDGGRYETHGRDSVATVRGTKWLTTDTCAGTVVKVFEGAVSVQPKAGGKPTLVKPGGRHFSPHRG